MTYPYEIDSRRKIAEALGLKEKIKDCLTKIVNFINCSFESCKQSKINFLLQSINLILAWTLIVIVIPKKINIEFNLGLGKQGALDLMVRGMLGWITYWIINNLFLHLSWSLLFKTSLKYTIGLLVILYAIAAGIFLKKIALALKKIKVICAYER